MRGSRARCRTRALNLGYGRVLNYNPNGPPPCDGCSADSFSVGLSDSAAIEDSLSGKRGLRLKVARSALAAAKMSRNDAQRNLEFQVKSAYVQVVLAVDALDFTREALKTNTVELDLNQRRYDKGAINEGDLARMKMQKLEAEQAVDSAIQTLRQARVSLAFLLGVRGRVPEFDIDREVLKYRIPDTLKTSSPDALLHNAFETRPDLRALGYQRQSAEAQIRLTKRQVFPDITVSANYTQTGTGQSAIQPPTLSFDFERSAPRLLPNAGRRPESRGQLQHAVAPSGADDGAGGERRRDRVRGVRGVEGSRRTDGANRARDGEARARHHREAVPRRDGDPHGLPRRPADVHRDQHRVSPGSSRATGPPCTSSSRPSARTSGSSGGASEPVRPLASILATLTTMNAVSPALSLSLSSCDSRAQSHAAGGGAAEMRRRRTRCG